MPGLSGRISTVFKAKVSKLLDRAEDPAETLEYSYQKQIELLQNVKKGLADVVTSKKRLQLQSQKLEQQVVKLDTQARQALAPGQRGARAHGARAEDRGADRAPGARLPGHGARAPAAADGRLRGQAAGQDRGLPLEEGGHQGPVLRRGGPGAHLRGGERRGRGDGRRRPRHAARGREDRGHARPRAGGRRARAGRRLRGPARSSATARTTSIVSSSSSPRPRRSTPSSRR